MNRKEFIKQGTALGLSLPFLSLFTSSCKSSIIDMPDIHPKFEGKVMIIGAGSAGLTAGYLLQQQGIDFEILEAAPVYGGRVKRADDFADFPIDLGAEWIHADPSVLSEVINDASVNADIEFVTYNPQTIYNWKNGELKKKNWASNFYSEYKFKRTTWYGFFEQFIVPSIEDRIRLNQPVENIEYGGNGVSITTSEGVFEADKVLVTLPVKMMQKGSINFEPALPTAKVDAYNNITMDDGLKLFFEFEERFYPDILVLGGLITGFFGEGKIFYDAAFRKDANTHVMGVFTINDDAVPYVHMEDDEIANTILRELDEIYDGKASEHYVKHIVQNWTKEPYIGGSYSWEFLENHSDIITELTTPVDDKVYFAGEALSVNHQATVHGACESAYAAISRITSG